MKNIILLLCLFVTASYSYAQVPENWDQLEVEAKWVADEDKIQEIKDTFVDGTQMYDFNVKVRWKGKEKVFVDRYYDNENNDLSNNGHVLRSRTVYKDAKKEWSKVQYKSTPSRVGAVWFRNEKGGCFTSHSKKSRRGDRCYSENKKAKDIIKAKNPEYLEHAAIKFMLEEHADFYDYDIKKKFEITDKRYRIVFEDDFNNPVFEISLDSYEKENAETEEITEHYEVELEILCAGTSEETLTKLFSVAEKLENDFSLIASEMTKSDISIDNLGK